VSLHYRRQDLPLGPSNMFFQNHIIKDTVLLRGVGPGESVVARRVRPNQWGVAAIGVGSGRPGSNATVGRSLDVDQPCDCQASPRGGARSDACMWTIACSEAAWSGGGDPY
jgi:hypothetical protein